jgi:glycosyltransferase involved in cell wall biosynthesis
MEEKRRKILCINPGASRTGAPILFLDLLKWLRANTTFEITILYCSNGDLETEFSEYGETYFWNGWEQTEYLEKYYLYRFSKRVVIKFFRPVIKTFQDKLTDLFIQKEFDLIYANTVGACQVINILNEKINCPIILHVRELEIAIKQFSGIMEFHKSISAITHFISDSEAVKKNLVINHMIPTEKINTVYEYINYNELNKISDRKELLRSEILKELDIPEGSFVIGSSGTLDWRKAPDIMLLIAFELLIRRKEEIFFVWVGGDEKEIYYEKLIYDCNKMGLSKYVRFVGSKSNPVEYFTSFDLFLLCSREEPVGIVAMEASSLQIPVLYFESAGGINEFTEENGIAIPYLDIISAAEKILDLKKNPIMIKQLGESLRKNLPEYDIEVAGRKIVTIFNSNFKQ